MTASKCKFVKLKIKYYRLLLPMTLIELKEQSKCFCNLALLNSDKSLIYGVHVC